MTSNEKLEPTFEREERFIVVKRKNLGSDEEPLRRYLAKRDIPTVECVVVESDWPEYEIVWAMIEARCTGRTQPDAQPDVVEAVDPEQAGWDWLDQIVSATSDEDPSDIAYDANQMVSAFIAGYSARRASLASSEARETQPRADDGEVAEEVKNIATFWLRADCPLHVAEYMRRAAGWRNESWGAECNPAMLEAASKLIFATLTGDTK